MPPPPRKPADSAIPLRPIKTVPRSILPPRPVPPQSPPRVEKTVPRRPPPMALPVAPVAPGINPGAALSASEMDRLRRRNLRSARRASVRQWTALAATAAAMIAAFTGGYLWKTAGASSADAAPAVVAPAQQQQALAFLDEAVTAKHEERYDEAISAVARARAADPTVPGGELLLAEIALHRGDSPVVRRAAREALARGQNVADANLLLALDKWQSRALPGESVANAGEAATQMLTEATAAEMSNGAAWFFLGDLQASIGRTAQARGALLGGLHRMQPWGSAAVVAAKRQVAAAEAGRAVAETPAGVTLVDLRRAVREGGDVQPLLDTLRSSLVASQTRVLLADAALATPQPPAPLARARSAAPDPIPHGSVAPPEARPVTSVDP